MEHWLKLELEAALPTFKKFQAINLHFVSPGYDYFKYGGSTKSTLQTFMGKKDSSQYIKLHRRIAMTHCTAEQYIVANFMEKGKCWVGSLANQAATNIAVKFVGFLENPSEGIIREFKEDIMDACIDDGVPFRSLVESTGNPMELPKLVTSHLSGDISIHSLVVLDQLWGLSKMYDEAYAGNFVWEEVSDRIKQRSGFYKFDRRATAEKLAAFLKEYW